MKVQVLHNQSLFDVAVQHSGRPEAAFDIAVKNGISITELLMSGEMLNGANILDADIVSYFSGKRIQPATASTASMVQDVESGGISIWAINNDFKVS